MSEGILMWLALCAGYMLSIAGLLSDMSRFNRKHLTNKYLTRGDVAFCALMALALPVGWFFGLKHIIGLKIDWDAPAFPKDRQ